ncbi:MAG: fumarate reductase subunit C [Acidobacteria bacterium]|nr:fumarate reductase subunit C [Acidobacteriota bacterium]
MSPGQVQPEYRQRVLPPRVSTLWWLGKGTYFAFILRELSCVFVAWFVAYLLLLVRAVSQGDASYQEFLAWSATTPILLLNLVSFLFLIFHTVTFFDAAPRAMVMKVGRNRVPGRVVLAGHYAGWAAASAIVCWLLLGA